MRQKGAIRVEWINQREIFKKSLKLLLFHSEEKRGRERETERDNGSEGKEAE